MIAAAMTMMMVMKTAIPKINTNLSIGSQALSLTDSHIPRILLHASFDVSHRWDSAEMAYWLSVVSIGRD